MVNSRNMQNCLLAVAAALMLSAAVDGRTLLASEAPASSSIINSILSKGIILFSFGEKTQVPVPILTGAADVGSFSLSATPSSNYDSKQNAILFQCRAVGNQIYTTNPNNTNAYVNSAAHADLWCGPGSAKISIKHFFANVSAQQEDFIGGSPSFEAVDGSGLAVGTKVATTDATTHRDGDGGLGSVGDVLLSVNGRGSFSDVTWIIRNNELGGQVPSTQQPLALASAALENFAPTGAENVPNAPLFIPYQADYTFFTGSRPNFPQPGVVTAGNAPSTASSG